MSLSARVCLRQTRRYSDIDHDTEHHLDGFLQYIRSERIVRSEKSAVLKS
jgi:hypothetical protein